MTLLLGDCIERMRELPEASVDAVVTDPPYGIAFMGKHWDRFDIERRVGKRDQLGPHHWSTIGTGRQKPRSESAFANDGSAAGSYDLSPRGNRAFQEWTEAWAVEAFRLLKPGGHLLSFAGTRTYHRMTCGVEDAGFEIRDCLAWLFGSGFPKSLNLEGEHEGWGTALKPAFEPITLARKPLMGTVLANVSEHGTGALNVAGCKIEGQPHAGGEHAVSIYGSDGNYKPGPNKPGNEDGRWPANVILDEATAAMLDEQTGELVSGGTPKFRNADKFRNTYGTFKGGESEDGIGGSVGGASRFFYCAKVSRAERDAGMEPSLFSPHTFEPRIADPYAQHRGRRMENQSHLSGNPPAEGRNDHPTVKPLALMRWLVRLITPAGGIVLDPFLGSGSTAAAATLEGCGYIGIEREPDYMRIAEARIAYWSANPTEAVA